jgi:cytochrome b6-f complex iron-sulfur subunit
MPPTGTTPEATTSRRTILAAIGGALAGGFVVSLLNRPRQPTDDEGLPTAELRIGAIDDVVEHIQEDGPLLLPDESGRLAVVAWEPSYRSESGSALDRYGPEAEDHPIIDDTMGVMVLSLLSTHLGCRVPFCESSQWFEDPCHGSRWNRWGEWTAGPAPRGLDRYRSRVTDDGNLVASLTNHIVGPFRKSGVFEQPQQGPSCIDG